MRSTMPAVVVHSITFCEAGFPVIISQRRKSTWPPSRAGMGRIFMKARATARKAAMFQNAIQSHESGKMLPMVPKPPTLFAPSLVKTSFIERAYDTSRSVPISMPRGTDWKIL